MLFFILFIILLQNCDAAIGSINESQYILMPPLFHLDPFESCIYQPGGVYCSLKFDLVSDGPSDLYTLIKEHADHTTTHFNHTELRHGICLTKTCRKFYQENTTEDLNVILEACLNESLWRDYKLKARVSDNVTCNKREDNIKIDASDITVGVVIAILLTLNIIGSFLEFQSDAKDSQQGFLSCFSLLRNWKKLVAPAAVGPEPRLTRLKGFYGLRSVIMLLVIMCHSLLPFVVIVDNPRFIEESYYNPIYMLFVNGALVIQTFFVMSGFLLAYNLQIYSETHPISWTVLPRATLNRWLRLTPAYAIVLALIATWLRHAGTGPLWQAVVGVESEDCRRNWWLHLLFLNFDSSQCMPETWYLAADLQLQIVGVAVCALGGRWRKSLLALLMTAGVLMPAVHTYLHDLNAFVVLSPEESRNFFETDPTFNHTHRRGHTNLASFVIGLALALAVYHWQKTEFKFPKFMKQRYIYWLTYPGLLAVLLLGSIFYLHDAQLPVYLRALYAGVVRPVFSGIFGVMIIGVVFKFENIYSGILEWDGWVLPSRVSYCAYLLHMAFIRLLTGTRTTLVHASILHLLEIVASSTVISFMAAIPFHLLVEAPLHNVVKWVTSTAPATKTPAVDLGCDKDKRA